MSQFIKQTKFYDGTEGSGNCTEAAVASILGLPLEAVPTFYDGTEGSQHVNLQKFMYNRGFEVLALQHTEAVIPDESMYLACGPSSRGCLHMVVMRDGKLLHDPHPSNEGILSVSYMLLLFPINPARLTYNPEPK